MGGFDISIGGATVEIPFHRWYPAITQRHSRRKFDPSKPVSPEMIPSLREICLGFRPFPEARVELVTESPDKVFKGVLGSYGKVKGALAYLAFIGNMQSPMVQEAVGYTGEGLILEAVSRGLGTCWVSGMFHPEVAGGSARIKTGERVLAVSPIGFPIESSPFDERMLSGFGRSHKRKPISELVSGLPEKEWPDWTREALEAARLAPSAYNRQPWRFSVKPDSILVSADEKIADHGTSRRLECGIAMLHLEIGAREKGKAGKWESLSALRLQVQGLTNDNGKDGLCHPLVIGFYLRVLIIDSRYRYRLE
jgi:nitroreductase